jgi:putative transposase
VRRRKRLAVARVPRSASRPTNDTWAVDFVSDALRTGRRFRCFTAVDVCTRECVRVHVDVSLPSEAVIAALEAAITTRGLPARLLRDNGAEFRSRVFDAWTADRNIALTFIRPGKPIQSSHIESFNSRRRDECLNRHWFLSLPDARARLVNWRHAKHHDRPHQSLHALTPTEYARTFAPQPRVRLLA